MSTTDLSRRSLLAGIGAAVVAAVVPAPPVAEPRLVLNGTPIYCDGEIYDLLERRMLDAQRAMREGMTRCLYGDDVAGMPKFGLSRLVSDEPSRTLGELSNWDEDGYDEQE